MKSCIAVLIPAIVATLLLGACTSAPKANFYMLNGSGPVAAAAQSPLVLAIGPIDLPQYLDRPHIVTRLSGNRLGVDEFNRWGGALEEDIVRVLAQRIGDRLGTRRIYSYPSRVVADTDYRIALDIRAFDGALGGQVSLDVSWSMIDDRNGRVVQTQQASYRSMAKGDDYGAYTAALGDTLSQLGDDLAVALGSLAPAAKKG